LKKLFFLFLFIFTNMFVFLLTIQAQADFTKNPYPVEQCGHWYQTDGWDAWKARRNECVWGDKVPARDYFGESFHTGAPNADIMSQFDSPYENEVYVQECWFEDPDPARKGEMWKIRRLGPFVTTGQVEGNDAWLAVKWYERLTPRFLTGRVFARFTGPIDEPELLGSPPIHIHHEHMSYSENLLNWVSPLQTLTANRIASIHGDQFDLRENNAFSAYNSYPLGTGKPIGFYTYDNELGDTRDENSSPLEWYSETGLRTSLKVEKKLFHMTRVNVGNLLDLDRFNEPENASNMFWFGWRMPATGEFKTNWLHTHGAERIMIFKGDAANAFLREHYSKPSEDSPLTIKSIDATAEDLIARAKAAGISVCEPEPQFEEVHYPERNHQTLETRATRVCCLPWKFNKGDGGAIVTFYDSRKARDPHKQHSVFRGDYVLENEEDVSDELFFNNLQICGEDPDTCVSTLTFGLKLTSVLYYGGVAATNTPFNRVIGYVMAAGILLSIAAILVVCWFGLRRLCSRKDLPDTPERSEYQKLTASPSVFQV